MDTDLEKLRRFCITAALIVVTYIFADVGIQSNVNITVLDIPLHVTRADLLPIGLVIGCFLGMVRFAYYGYFVGSSPYRIRRELLDSLKVFFATDQSGAYDVKHLVDGNTMSLYFGPREFGTPLGDGDKYVHKIADAFPRFLSSRAHIEEIKSNSYWWVSIPRACRIAAVFQDIDYSAPVWLSAFAVILFVAVHVWSRHNSVAV